jgi:Integral membrane protein
MIEIQSNHSGEYKRQLIVLSPNKSMTWETNKKILIAMFAVSMMIGISFASIGAWMVLPFAGLEITLVGIGMYYVCWKLNFKQTITVEAESFTLQKGVYFPKQEWQWQASQTYLLKQPSRYRMSPPTLFLKHLNQKIEIGEFLNRTDKKELQEWLRNIGIGVTTLAAK